MYTMALVHPVVLSPNILSKPAQDVSCLGLSPLMKD